MKKIVTAIIIAVWVLTLIILNSIFIITPERFGQLCPLMGFLSGGVLGAVGMIVWATINDMF